MYACTYVCVHIFIRLKGFGVLNTKLEVLAQTLLSQFGPHTGAQIGIPLYGTVRMLPWGKHCLTPTLAYIMCRRHCEPETHKDNHHVRSQHEM